jgi:lysyl-tRNA synthetase class 2
MLQGIRRFFNRRNVLEVETPALSSAAATDPAIHSAQINVNHELRYLHTSPEFPMKRLLAAGSGDIFQICRVFRQGEIGCLHHPEFTLLEWYRHGFDHHRLADEVVELIGKLLGTDSSLLSAKKVTYQALFQEKLGIDPMGVDLSTLESIALNKGVHPECKLSFDGWLDLLFSLCLAPSFPSDRLTIVHSYPASQAALARLNIEGMTSARFEVFWGELELANGFHELSDASEQRRRFEVELKTREEIGLPRMPMDERLLSALRAGLPDCAGVALGLDRVLMRLVGASCIDEVLTFPFGVA